MIFLSVLLNRSQIEVF